MASRADRKRRQRQPDSRRHHFVPAGYLGFFASPPGRTGQIFVWDSKLKKGWVTKPEHVAFEDDLYRLDPGDSPHELEEALAKAEGVMIRAIRQVDSKPLETPTI